MTSDKSALAESDNLGWTYIGEFGGFAKETTNSSDPWEQRFEDGKFVLLSGICATDNEVWACDLEVSRIQVFDLAGNHLRNIGLGCPLEGTLQSLRDTFFESAEKSVRDTDFWEDTNGNTWRSRKHDLFKAADVEVVPGGYYLADWVKTSLRGSPMRDFGVYFVEDGGGISQVEFGDVSYPAYLAVDGVMTATSDPFGTSLWAAYFDQGKWSGKALVTGLAFRQYLTLDEFYGETTDYLPMLYRLSHSGQALGEYVFMGGLDIAFEKLVVCDKGNRRLQVVSMVHDVGWKFGHNLRTINGAPFQGKVRFDSPLDISIATDGTMFIIDAGKLEVAVLDAGFNRIGTFGRGDFIEPYAIDLSDDGKHCYISDRRGNTIHHYASSN